MGEATGFSFWSTVIHNGHLRSYRERACRDFERLNAACAPLFTYPQSFQEHVATVAKAIHASLIAILIFVVRWPDTILPKRFLEGFQFLGVMAVSGLLQPAEASDVIGGVELARMPGPRFYS